MGGMASKPKTYFTWMGCIMVLKTAINSIVFFEHNSDLGAPDSNVMCIWTWRDPVPRTYGEINHVTWPCHNVVPQLIDINWISNKSTRIPSIWVNVPTSAVYLCASINPLIWTLVIQQPVTKPWRGSQLEAVALGKWMEMGGQTSEELIQGSAPPVMWMLVYKPH